MSATINALRSHAMVFDFSMWTPQGRAKSLFLLCGGCAFRLGHQKVLASASARLGAPSPPFGPPCSGWPVGVFLLVLFVPFS